MKWVVIVTSLLLFAIMGALPFAGPFLIVDDELERADLCHVLSGNQKRVVFAIELYGQGLCGKIVFIGGPEDGTQSFASRQKAYALDHDIPESAIVIDETDVYSTFSEIARFKHVIQQALPPASTVTHVTDPFHTRRVRMVSRWILDDALGVQIASVPFELSFSDEPWWSSRRSRRMVFREYVKLVFYWLRYRIPFPPMNDWMSRFDRIND